MSESDQQTLDHGEQVLLSRCMARAGFTVVPTPSAPTGSDQLRLPVLTNPQWARAHGYGGRDTRMRRQLAQRDPNQRYFAALAPDRQRAALAALNGDGSTVKAELPGLGVVSTPRTGCRAEAQRQLYGDIGVWLRVDTLADNLRALYTPQLVADPRYTAAVAAWSGCMAKAGHPFGSPNDIRDRLPDLTRGVTPEQADAIESRLAVTEAVCARSTPLATVVAQLGAAYADQTRRAIGDDWRTYVRLERAALPLARSLKSGAAVPAG